jgi:hypothetical protein
VLIIIQVVIVVGMVGVTVAAADTIPVIIEEGEMAVFTIEVQVKMIIADRGTVMGAKVVKEERRPGNDQVDHIQTPTNIHR